MARILAIDTTGEFGSLALVEGDALLEQVILHSPEGFGHVLFDQVQKLIGRHGWTLGQVDCFASASGPGSFTGVRIGLAAAKGFAEATGKPAAGVSNLKALAWYGSHPLRAVFVDARRGEIYGAVYSADLQAVSEERVMKFPAWLETLPAGDLELISTDPSLYPGQTIQTAPRTLAEAIAHIAHADYVHGLARDPAALDANYVRRSDAELLWKDR